MVLGEIPECRTKNDQRKQTKKEMQPTLSIAGIVTEWRNTFY